jgi:hypothetical protein
MATSREDCKTKNEKPVEHHAKLIGILENLLKKSETQPVQVKDILKEVKKDGFPLLTLIHSLPFVQPIPLGPLAMAAGVSLACLGYQMLKNQPCPWLPQKIANATLSKKTCRILLLTCEKTLKICRKISRPRLQILATGPIGKKLGGTIIFLSGILLTIPLAAIPFTNTLPASAASLASIAELEDDGLLTILSLICLLLAFLFFGFLGWIALTATKFTFTQIF